MFNVTLEGKDALLARLDQMPTAVKAALEVKVTGLALDLEALVKQKLSGQVLHVRTGALRRSIFNEVTSTDTTVTGRVFSAGDVKYAAIQEFGGQTGPHDIAPKNAAALAFTIGGRQVFAKIVHHPGSRIPERSFMRSSLAERSEAIVAGMREAVLQGVRTGIGH